MFFVRLFVCLCALLPLAAKAQATPTNPPLFVVANDVEMRYIDGVLRFCPRQNLRGLVCGAYVDFFGKRRFMVQDWWTVQSYVEAALESKNFELSHVAPNGTGDGLVIYFYLLHR